MTPHTERHRLYVDEAAPPLEEPAEPRADATSHDPREIVTRQPREVVGKESAALGGGRRHSGYVRVPEGAMSAESVSQGVDG